MRKSRASDADGVELRTAAFCCAAVAGACIATATLLLPGRIGGAVVRLCGAGALAFFVYAVHRRLNAVYRQEMSMSTEAPPGSGARAPFAAGAAAGIACTLALGPVAAMSEEVVGGFFAWGIAGMLVAAAAVVLWARACVRRAARWRDPASAVPPAPLGIACAATATVGLGACFNIASTPVSDIAMWAALSGVAVAAALAFLAWRLFHTPKMAVQLGAMHDHLQDAEGALSRLSANYDDLSAQHEIARRASERHASEIESLRERQAAEIESLEERRAAEVESLRRQHEAELESLQKLQAAEVESLRKQQAELEGARGDKIEAVCARIAEERELSSREHDVMALLARGWTRQRIADELVVEKSTVSSHIVRLYRKLDVHSTQELIDYVEDYS